MSGCQRHVFRVDGDAAGADVSLQVEEMEMSVALTCRIILAALGCVRVTLWRRFLQTLLTK